MIQHGPIRASRVIKKNLCFDARPTGPHGRSSELHGLMLTLPYLNLSLDLSDNATLMLIRT